jgi:hypothetical protein
MTESRNCQNCKQDFVIYPEDSLFYERISVPPPTFCPDCRMARRMNFRNLRSLYRRTCGLCNKSIITMYHSDDPAPVYCTECWQGDGWDARDYAQEIDWARPFLEQWRELFQKVPRYPLWKPGGAMQNSEYTNYSIDNKNCYLSYSVVRCEDTFYSENIDDSKQCGDCLYVKGGELCYENIDSNKNSHCAYTFQCRDSIDSWFIFDCANSQNCFMSANLRNGRYVFRGEQISREEYMKRMADIDTENPETIQELKKEFRELIKKSIHRYAYILQSPGAIGEQVQNSREVFYGFNVYNAENIRYGARVLGGKDLVDVYGSSEAELSYEGVASSFGVANSRFCFLCDNTTSDITYCALCKGVTNCFGSIAIKKKSYCILNKEYSKEEYEALVPKLITHMNERPYVDAKGREYRFGEFFPFEFAPFAYNETVAHDYFPVDEALANERGYQWKGKDLRDYKITIDAASWNAKPSEVSDEITKEIIGCINQGNPETQCTTAFRITPDELVFLRRMKVSFPKQCPNCRHYERLATRAPMRLHQGACTCAVSIHGHEVPCGTAFETPWDSEHIANLYCEQCYQQEVS